MSTSMRIRNINKFLQEYLIYLLFIHSLTAAMEALPRGRCLMCDGELVTVPELEGFKAHREDGE